MLCPYLCVLFFLIIAQFQRGDGPKMAFQTAGSSNRSIHKNKESKKQPNLTYRSTQNNSFDKDREFDSKKTSNDLNSSYDKGHSGTNYSSEPHGYDYSSTQEVLTLFDVVFTLYLTPLFSSVKFSPNVKLCMCCI